MMDNTQFHTEPAHCQSRPIAPSCRVYCFIPLILLLLSALFFLTINSSIKTPQDWTTLKYASEDSASYRIVGDWLLLGDDDPTLINNIAKRPFLYPVTVATLEKIHPWAILIYQMLLWQAQIILVYFCALLLSNSPVKASTLSLLCTVLLSPVGLTLHVLTETTVSFLLTSSLLVIILYLRNNNKNQFILFYLFLISLCEATKPSYFYIFLLHYVIFFLLWKNKRIKDVALYAALLLPIIGQIAIMHAQFNTNKLSFIATFAINDYFLSSLQLYTNEHKQNSTLNQKHTVVNRLKNSREARRTYLAGLINESGYKSADKQINQELFATVRQFPQQSFKLFTDLIRINSRQPSYYLTTDNDETNKLYRTITLWQSGLIRTLNILSLLSFLLLLPFFLKKNSRIGLGNFILFNTIATSIILFTYISNGVTYWQGDRLLTPIYFISLIWFFHQVETAYALLPNKG